MLVEDIIEKASRSQNISVVNLLSEPTMGPQIKDLTRYLRKGRFSAILDFSGVEVLPSDETLLLLMAKEAKKRGHVRMVLCQVSEKMEETLRACGLREMFEIVDSKESAMGVLMGGG